MKSKILKIVLAFTCLVLVAGAASAASRPIADFYSPQIDRIIGYGDSLQVGTSYNFYDLSTNNPTSWLWDFGDGSTSTLKKPSHAYRAMGGYTVTLSVRNSAGSSTKTRYGYALVDAGEIPVPAHYSANVRSGTAPLTVTFHDDDGNGPSGIGPIWREWHFGDGITGYYLVDNNASATPYATHTYTRPGRYTVSLWMDNRLGHSIITKYQYITVTEPRPVASFVANRISGRHPLTVNFASTSTGSLSSYHWVFGDGNELYNTLMATHTYNKAGNYSVSLTVTNSVGSNTLRKTSYITVS